MQRRGELESRLHDNQLGYAAPSGERAPGGAEVGRFVLDRMDELLTLVSQVESLMLTPAFVGVFGDPGDEGSADADGILHAANRLMTITKDSSVWRSVAAASQRRVATQGYFATWRT